MNAQRRQRDPAGPSNGARRESSGGGSHARSAGAAAAAPSLSSAEKKKSAARARRRPGESATPPPKRQRPPHTRKLQLDTSAVSSSVNESAADTSGRRQVVRARLLSLGTQGSHSTSLSQPEQSGTSGHTLGELALPTHQTLGRNEEDGAESMGTSSLQQPCQSQYWVSADEGEPADGGCHPLGERHAEADQSRRVVPPALEESLMRSTALAAAEAAAAAHAREPSNDLHEDGASVTQRERPVTRVAALQPIVTEEWARSMIKPGEEYLLYSRPAGGGGYGGVSLGVKGGGGQPLRGGRRGLLGQQAATHSSGGSGGGLSMSSAAAVQRIEEEARRRQAAELALVRRQASQGHGRAVRSVGSGRRATSYGSTMAASLSRAPTTWPPSQSSLSVSMGRSHVVMSGPLDVEPRRSGTTPPHTLLSAGDRSPSLDAHGGGGLAEGAAFHRVASPLPNPSGGYRDGPLPASVSPPPSQVRGAHLTSTLLDVSCESAPQTARGGHLNSSVNSFADVSISSSGTHAVPVAEPNGVLVRPDARVMRRRRTPMLFTRPVTSPSLFPPAAGTSAVPAESSAGTPPQQRQQAGRRQSSKEYDLMVSLRARMLSQLAGAKNAGGRVSTEAHPKLATLESPDHVPAAAAKTHAPVSSLPTGEDARDHLRDSDAVTPSVTGAQDGSRGRVSLGSRRRPDIAVPEERGRGRNASAIVASSPAEHLSDAASRLLSDPLFPLTSEENYERLCLCNQEYLTRKHLNDRRQLLNYYAAAAANAPLPPSLLSTPSEGELASPDEAAADFGAFVHATTRSGSSFPHSSLLSAPQRPTARLPGGAGAIHADASSLGRDVSASESSARPSTGSNLSGTAGRPARPIRLNTKAPTPPPHRQRKATNKAPPPAQPRTSADTTAGGGESGTAPLPPALSPPDLEPLAASRHEGTTRDGGRKPTDSRSEASMSSAPDTPRAQPCRVSLGGESGGHGSRTSPLQSPARHTLAAPAASHPTSPLPPSAQSPGGGGGGGGGGNSPTAPAFIANAVMPSVKTGPIAPISTSSIGYMSGGGTGAAVASPLTSNALGAAVGAGLGSKSTSPGSSRAGSLQQTPLLSSVVGSAERRGSGVGRTGPGGTSGAAAPLPSPSSPQTSSQPATQEDEDAQRRLWDALDALLSPSPTAPTQEEKGSHADLKAFVAEYRHHLIDEGFLLPVSRRDAVATDGATASPAEKAATARGRKGIRWQGTAAGPFMLALRRETFMEETAPDAVACVEVGADDVDGSPERHGSLKEVRKKQNTQLRGRGGGADVDDSRAKTGDGAVVADDTSSVRCDSSSDDIQSLEEGGHPEAASDVEEGGTEEADDFLANLDDNSSHQRNVQYILELFGSFMKSGSACRGNKPVEAREDGNDGRGRPTAAGPHGVPASRMYDFLCDAEETRQQRDRVRAMELMLAPPNAATQ